MKVEIWSDVVCPWCYIGKRRFERALAAFPHRAEVDVVWRAFELDPAAPAVRDGAYAERLAEKYGTPVPQAQAMVDRMTATAAGDGLEFRFDRAQPGNTFDAHRLLHLALERGRQDEVKERLFRGYLTDGDPIGDREALVRLAADAGLDPAEARAVLDSDTYADAVRADERQAAAYGISAVPCFVFEGRYGVSGAQPAEALLDVMTKVWAEEHPVTFAGGDAAACEGDACAV